MITIDEDRAASDWLCLQAEATHSVVEQWAWLGAGALLVFVLLGAAHVVAWVFA